MFDPRSEEHTSELQSPQNLVCRLLLEKKEQRRLPPRHRPDDARPALGPRRPPPGASPLRCLRSRDGSRFVDAKGKKHFFFFNDTAPTEIYTLSLHDALPI